MIHTFGDSHSQFGFNTIPNINIHHLGPKLCSSIGRDGIDINGYGVYDDDIVIFSFGEIDCRCHVYKYITKDISHIEIINSIVDNYFIKIQECVALLKVKVCIYNVVPAVEKDSCSENRDFPYLGTDEIRKTFVSYFNKKLMENCVKYNYIFFNIHDMYVDENGFLDKSLSDNVHIKDGKYIEEFIQNKINK